MKLRGPRVHTVLFFDSHTSLSYLSFLSHGHFSVCSKKKKISFNYLLISNLPLRLTYFAYIMYVVYDYVCVHVCLRVPKHELFSFSISLSPFPPVLCRYLDRKTSPISFTRGSCRPRCGPAPWASLIAVNMSPPVTPRHQVSMCHILGWLCLQAHFGGKLASQ